MMPCRPFRVVRHRLRHLLEIGRHLVAPVRGQSPAISRRKCGKFAIGLGACLRTGDIALQKNRGRAIHSWASSRLGELPNALRSAYWLAPNISWSFTHRVRSSRCASVSSGTNSPRYGRQSLFFRRGAVADRIRHPATARAPPEIMAARYSCIEHAPKFLHKLAGESENANDAPQLGRGAFILSSGVLGWRL